MTLYFNEMIKFRSIHNNEYFHFFRAAILNFKDRLNQNLVKYTKSFKYVEFFAPSIKSTVVCAILENNLECMAAILKLAAILNFEGGSIANIIAQYTKNYHHAKFGAFLII